MFRKLLRACVGLLIALGIGGCFVLPFMMTNSADEMRSVSLKPKENPTMQPSPVREVIEVQEQSLVLEDMLTLLPAPEESAEVTPEPEKPIAETKAPELADHGIHFLLQQHTDEGFLTLFDAVYRGVLAFEEHIELPNEATHEQADRINRLLQIDFPELFYYSHLGRYYFRNGDSDRICAVDVSYSMDQSRAEAAQRELDAVIQPILLDAKGLPDYEKEKLAHDRLIEICKYDLGGPHKQSIYGALVEGRAVCAGYTNAMIYLLRQMGISCAYLSGTCVDEDGVTDSHAWNLVCIDGVWALLDATWDDPIGDKDALTYTYFNLNSAIMDETHKLEAFYDCYSLPECSSMDVSYSAKEGVLIRGNGFDEALSQLIKAFDQGETRLCLQFVNREDYVAAASDVSGLVDRAADACGLCSWKYSWRSDEKGLWLEFTSFEYE